MLREFSSKVLGKSNGTEIPGNNFSSFLKLNLASPRELMSPFPEIRENDVSFTAENFGNTNRNFSPSNFHQERNNQSQSGTAYGTCSYRFI